MWDLAGRQDDSEDETGTKRRYADHGGEEAVEPFQASPRDA